MTIPLVRIHHLEQAIRRRRMLAIRYNSKRSHAGDSWGGVWQEYYGNLYWFQMDRISALLQALHRSRAVYHHNIGTLERLPKFDETKV